MKRTVIFVTIIFFTHTVFAQAIPDWIELLGDWDIIGQTLSPDSQNYGNKPQYVLSRKDMNAESQWSKISVAFKLNENIDQYSVGIALNIIDSCDFGILRIYHKSNTAFLQAGRWKYGEFRSFINFPLDQDLKTEEWYNLSIYPTESRKEWQPWTIALADCKTNELIFEKGIQNEMPLFGRGISGIYTTSTNASFKDFNIQIKSEPSSCSYLKLAPLFTDGMVLQRNEIVPVWGRSKPKTSVQVKINNQSFTSKSDASGYWQVNLPSMKAIDRTIMSVVSGEDSLTLHDVAVGEVWLASGQSNMQMKVWQSDMDLISQTLPPDKNLRMFIQPKWPSENSIFTSGGNWEYAIVDNTPNWSAVAYIFALQLREKLQVPVGIICSYWGGTAAESWLPREELLKDSLTRPIFESYNKAKDALENGIPFKDIHPWNIPGQRHAPGYLFNGMIFPHIPFTFKGVIWYQGESNSQRAKQYETLFPMLISSWRNAWNNPQMPFLFVQIAGYDGKQSGSNIESAWPQLRDAQRQTLQKSDNTGMAVTIDLGSKLNIHPAKKREVGERLARLALHDVYGYENIVRCGPLYKSITFKRKQAEIEFTETSQGLQVPDGESLQGFTIAGEDQKFYTAHAVINPDKKCVRVWSNKVKNPVAVRYAWENFPDKANLINSAGLPASPFRTDQWPLPTDNNY